MKQQTNHGRGLSERLQRLATSLVALGMLVLSFSVPIWAQSAFVRVNQVGYVSTASKRAYLMTATTETGATFSVKNSGGTSVYSAPIGARQGAWGSFSNVYALDFDSVSTAGTYTISVTGPASATSVSFKIDTGASLYSGALSNTLKFYQTERDGPNFIPNALRTAAGHLNDASAKVYFTPTFDRKDNGGPLTATGAVIDASGGWWDAGDYLKFVETHSYTVGMMLLGVRDFPNQMGTGSSTSNFTAEAQFGLDWLQKMWDDNSKTLYYQVSTGSGGHNYAGDHDIWRLPQVDDTYQGCVPPYQYICNRPVFINPAGGAGASISPNLAGRMAADFAECYQVFKMSNPSYANQCLLSAEHVFDLANTAPTGNLVTAAPFDFYPETEWRDDLEWGAAELYFALAGGGVPVGLPHTDPMFYLTAAANWANACINGTTCEAEPLNLYTVSELAHFELYRAIAQAGNPPGLAVTQTALLNDMNKGLQKALTQAATDPFGFGFPWAHYDTTSFGGGLTVMAWMYGNLTNSTTYAPFTSRWQANVLGANAWGISQIIGLGTTFSHCPSHQVANLAGSLDGTPPVLLGAAGEGPNSFASTGLVTGMVVCPPNGVDVFAPFNGNGAVYADNQQSYSTDEPAIDLTASSFLSFSWAIAGAPGGGTPPTPDFSISATPSSQTITQSNSTTYTATVSALNGFTGTVSFSVSGLPSGATGSFNPTSVAGSGNSTLTVSTTTSTPAGTHTLTITGTSGSLTHNTNVTLVVQAASSGGNVTCTGGLPAGWTNNSIGGGSVASASCSNNTFTVQSNGYGFSGKFDQGDLVSESISGNHTVIAHVASVSSDGTAAQTGVMIRNSTDAADQFAYVYINPSGGTGVNMIYRSTSSGGITTAGSQSGINPPYWVKLVLSSGTFTGYSSADGTTWAKVGSVTFNMTNTNVLIGLAAANNSTATNTSTFDNVSVTAP